MNSKLFIKKNIIIKATWSLHISVIHITEARYCISALHENQTAKYKAAEVETTDRCDVCVFLHAVCVTQGEVASDAQLWGGQVKGHSDGSPFLLDHNMFGVPVWNQTVKY